MVGIGIFVTSCFEIANSLLLLLEICTIQNGYQCKISRLACLFLTLENVLQSTYLLCIDVRSFWFFHICAFWCICNSWNKNTPHFVNFVYRTLYIVIIILLLSPYWIIRQIAILKQWTSKSAQKEMYLSSHSY